MARSHLSALPAIVSFERDTGVGLIVHYRGVYGRHATHTIVAPSARQQQRFRQPCLAQTPMDSLAASTASIAGIRRVQTSAEAIGAPTKKP
jgi:hypothetical protein